MALYVYEIATGRLESWNPTDGGLIAPDDVLAARGLAKLAGAPALDETHAWDEARRNVVTVVPKHRPRNIACSRFVLAFSAAEFAAIAASPDPVVKQLMLAIQVSPEIDIAAQSTINGVAYLVFAGLLSEARAAAVLATE